MCETVLPLVLNHRVRVAVFYRHINPSSSWKKTKINFLKCVLKIYTSHQPSGSRNVKAGLGWNNQPSSLTWVQTTHRVYYYYYHHHHHHHYYYYYYYTISGVLILRSLSSSTAWLYLEYYYTLTTFQWEITLNNQLWSPTWVQKI